MCVVGGEIARIEDCVDSAVKKVDNYTRQIMKDWLWQPRFAEKLTKGQMKSWKENTPKWEENPIAWTFQATKETADEMTGSWRWRRDFKARNWICLNVLAITLQKEQVIIKLRHNRTVKANQAVCVCVCVCVWERKGERERERVFLTHHNIVCWLKSSTHNYVFE